MLLKPLPRAVEEFPLIWPDLLRGLAIICVVVHHWILFNPHQSSSRLFYDGVELIGTLAGTAVHLFFILSGYGLTISYLRSKDFSWKGWIERRIRKILVPYWVIVFVTFLLADTAHRLFPLESRVSFSYGSLLSYFTLARNFYSAGWELNPTLWFMPVIVGLYLLFPFLTLMLKNFGVLVLLGVSLFVTYASITLCLWNGHEVSHQSALPFFFLGEFALGMVLGHFLFSRPACLLRLLSWKYFAVGISCYFASWILTKAWEHGSEFNDLLTAIGVFIIALRISRLMCASFPHKSIRVLQLISRHSYLMYLIHGALILYIFRPLFLHLGGKSMDSLTLIMLAGPFCFVVYVIALSISPAVNTIANLNKSR